MPKAALSPRPGPRQGASDSADSTRLRPFTAAFIVNPYDLEEAGGALAIAVEMDGAEQRARMQALRAVVAENNVFRWAGRMLADGARARVSDRLTSEVYSRTALPGQESIPS